MTKNTEKMLMNNIVDYVNEVFDSGYDGYSDDIVLDGFKNKQIDITPRTLIKNFDRFCTLMDENFDDSSIGLGYMRFLVRFLKLDIMSYADIRLMTYKYGLSRYALENYSNLTDKKINQIFEYIRMRELQLEFDKESLEKNEKIN